MEWRERMSRRTTCLFCHSELTEPLFRLKNVPALAQNMPTNSEEIKKDVGIDLSLHQCPYCGLVQLDSPPVFYYRDVIRSGGYATTMKDLRLEQYRGFIKEGRLENKKIIEVGCGAGEFLSLLQDNFPVKAYGIEHNPDLVKAARDAGLNVQCGFIETNKEKLNHAPFEAFMMFNFLEHLPDPSMFLQGICSNLSDESWGLITVPAWEYIYDHNGFYELIADHIAYYSKETFCRMLEMNGFEIVHCEIINRDTWSATVKKIRQTDLSQMEKHFFDLKNEILNAILSWHNQNKTISVWGAGHQGLTAISSMNLEPYLQFVIDSAPFKQGKYTPASHLKIISPTEFYSAPTDVVIVMAPGYTDEIVSLLQNRVKTIAVLRTDNLEIVSDQ